MELEEKVVSNTWEYPCPLQTLSPLFYKIICMLAEGNAPSVLTINIFISEFFGNVFIISYFNFIFIMQN